jgi:hypothetical protein
MQKKDIKIGEKYGVLAHVGKRAVAKSGATIVDFNGEHEVRSPGMWSYSRRTVSNGISIRFDEPVVKRWDGYIPLQEILDGQWVDSFKEEAKKDAITTDVLPSARHVVGLWSEIVNEREVGARRRAEWQAENRAKAEAFKPRRKALARALDEAGVLDDVRISYHQYDGGSGNDAKVITGISEIRITMAALEKLLGLEGEA